MNWKNLMHPNVRTRYLRCAIVWTIALCAITLPGCACLFSGVLEVVVPATIPGQVERSLSDDDALWDEIESQLDEALVQRLSTEGLQADQLDSLVIESIAIEVTNVLDHPQAESNPNLRRDLYFLESLTLSAAGPEGEDEVRVGSLSGIEEGDTFKEFNVTEAELADLVMSHGTIAIVPSIELRESPTLDTDIEIRAKARIVADPF